MLRDVRQFCGWPASSARRVMTASARTAEMLTSWEDQSPRPPKVAFGHETVPVLDRLLAGWGDDYYWAVGVVDE